MNIFQFLIIFFVFNLSVLSFYIFGHLLFKLFKKEISNLSILNIGIKILVGITSFTSLIAIIKTAGVTVQSIILPVILFFVYQFNTKEFNSKTNDFKKLMPFFFIISLITFSFHYFLFYHLPDHLFYSKLGQSIFETGTESWSSLYKSYINSKGISLYHFSDIWLSEFISKIGLNNSLTSLTKIVYPIYHFLTFIIIIGILSEKITSLKKTLIITLAIIYGSAFLIFPLLSLKQGHHTFWHYSLPEISSFKSLSIYPYILLSLYYLKRRQLMLFTILICLSCLQYFTLTVSLLPATNLILCSYFIFRKELKKECISAFLLLNFATLTMIVISTIFKDTVKTNSSFENIKHIIHPINYYLNNWKFYMSLFFDYFSRAFYLFPIATILALKYVKREKIIFSYILITLFISVIFYTIFNELTNSVQAISILIGPLMLFLTIDKIILLEKKTLHICITVLLVIGIFNLKSINTINNGNIKLSKYEKKLLLFSLQNLNNKDWIYYSENPYSTWMYNAMILKSPILLNNNSKLPIEIAPFFMEKYNIYKQKNKDAPLCKIEHNLKSLLQLLKQRKIKYVFIENKITTNQNFMKSISPILTNKNYGLYKINSTSITDSSLCKNENIY